MQWSFWFSKTFLNVTQKRDKAHTTFGGVMHRFMMILARVFAFAGGVMLLALVLLTCVSITGRGFGFGPITGDFELVEAGIVFCIFAFLPLCHLTGAHASVDIFTKGWSPRANRWRQMLTDLVFAAVLVAIAVQLGAGTASKWRSGQTTFLIEFPIWWAYALALIGAGVVALVACYLAVVRVVETATGRALIPPNDGVQG